MIVKQTLNVSAEAYFNLLQKYLLKDLKKTVNKSISLKDIKQGFCFEKTYRTKQKDDFVSKQEIVELSYPSAYCLRFSIPNGFQKISHHIKTIDENQVEITYEEVVETNFIPLRIQQFSRRRKARALMNQLLKNLELEIQSKK